MSEQKTEVYQFRPNPGPRERHLKRQHRNPLFADVGMITQRQVNEARQEDLAELDEFTTALRQLVSEAVELPRKAESDIILGLKERADKLYEQASGLGGELGAELEAVRKLTGVIMDAVRRGAGVDPTALNELDQEDQARRAHYALLNYPLVADLLRPDSPIPREHLVASLLSAPPDEARAATGLFDAAQIEALTGEADRLLSGMGDATPWCDARAAMDEALQSRR